MASSSRKSFISEEDDAYWGASSKGFDFNDDNLQEAKQIMGDLRIGPDMQDEVINWDGSSAVSFEKSARYHPPAKPKTQTAPQPSVPHSFSADTFKASVTHTRSASLGKFEPSSSPLQRSTVSGSDPSIDDVVRSSTPAVKGPSIAEHAKMMSEMNMLKRQLQNSKRDRWATIPVEDTVKRMVNGEAYSLEMYKSKADKLALVDAAVAIHDGNAIMAAVLFLKNTIKPSIFNMELMRRPVACDHYLHYLRMHYDFNDLCDMLGMLGRSEEAAILKYQQAVISSSPDRKIKSLQTCLNAHYHGDPTVSHEADLVQQQIDLLQRQLPVEASDSQAEQNKSHALFQQHPRKTSLVGMSLITTLYYCCFYHYELSENYLASPKALRTAHQLTDRQFVTTALRAQSKLRRWLAIDKLFESKNWLGKSQMKAPISFVKVVDILVKCNASTDVLSKYLKFIEDLDERLSMAKKCQCHMIVIETLKVQKDRAQLEHYLKKVEGKQYVLEYKAIQDLLRNTSIKWKT